MQTIKYSNSHKVLSTHTDIWTFLFSFFLCNEHSHITRWDNEISTGVLNFILRSLLRPKNFTIITSRMFCKCATTNIIKWTEVCCIQDVLQWIGQTAGAWSTGHLKQKESPSWFNTVIKLSASGTNWNCCCVAWPCLLLLVYHIG
jgi:hypothetical protein